MIRLTRAQVQPIGLDIGHQTVRMLQVEIAGDGESLAVTAAAQQRLSDETRQDPALRLASAVTLIRQMLRDNPFVGRSVVPALPREMLQVKNLRLPLMPPSDLEAAVHFEAQNLFGAEAEQMRLHHLPVGEVRQGGEVRQEVLVLAARNEDIHRSLEHFHRAGLVVESLDTEPCAMFRSLERFIRRREDEMDVNVIVDVGLCSSQVVIGRGRDMSFYKAIDIAGHSFHEAVRRKLSITVEEAQTLRRRLADAGENADPARRDSVRQAVLDAARGPMEELAREISLCLRYYSVTFRGQRPTRLRLIGGEAHDPQLLAILGASLTIPVESARPLFSVNTSRMRPDDRRGSLAAWATAFGLGLKCTSGHFGPRDGKPRDSVVPSPAKAEVVDLAQAVQAAADSEVAHA